MPRIPVKGGPFDGHEVEYDEPFPLRIEMCFPVGNGQAGAEETERKPTLRHAVYVYFRGAGQEAFYRPRRG